MGEVGMSEAAGVVGAVGASLLLLSARRTTLFVGAALVAVAEVILADSHGPNVSPTVVAAGIAGLALLGAGAALFVWRPELVLPALVIVAPFRPPLDFDRSHRFLFTLAHGGKLGRLVPLYVV